MLALLFLCLAASAPQSTALVSVASDGTFANDDARVPCVSADGRHVAFDARATNLVPGDVNRNQDVFVRDLGRCTTELVSVGTLGQAANGQSGEPCLSGDGRFVAFESLASNLVAGDTNGLVDVFVRDRAAATTTRVSVSSAGVQGDGSSGWPAISADGRYVAFDSTSSNLVAGDTNSVADVFVHDRLTGTTWRASTSAGGAQGSGASIEPALSADGARLAFASAASELVPGDTNDRVDVFVKHLATGSIVRVSVDSSGNQANHESGTPSLSADGFVAAFRSSASNLVPGDSNGYPDIILHDLQSGQTTLVSVNAAGVQADHGGLAPSLSGDGTQVAFLCFSTNMGYPGYDLVFLRDVLAGTTELVSVSTQGETAGFLSSFPSISADGRIVAFMTKADNLIPNATNDALKVLIRDRQGCASMVSTYCTASTTSLAGCAAQIGSSGMPSLAAALEFEVYSGPIPGGTLGIACVGTTGPDSMPFGTQGGNLCVGQFLRSAILESGGSSGACDGELRLTLADLAPVQPALAQPSCAGWVSFWFRDPASSDGFGLSDGLWFVTCP